MAARRGEGGVGGDAGLHAGVEVGDGGGDRVDGGVAGRGGVGIEFSAELAERSELLDELAPEGEQVAEEAQLVRFGGSAVEVLEEAVAGEHGGIDAVVFGELADGFSEAAGAQGIDEDGFESGLEEALVQVAVEAPGGFEDGTGDAVLEQPVAQGAAAGLGVVELAVESAIEDVGVERALADVDAGHYSGGGRCHSCVPILLRYGATPTLPFRSRRNGSDGPTQLRHGAWHPGATRSDPSPPVGPGQAPPGASLRWGREESDTGRSGGLRHLRPRKSGSQVLVMDALSGTLPT